MFDDFEAFGLFSLAELNYLRLEAMDLFDRCLAEGKTEYLETFIQHQISQDPPRLELLRELEEDLHQRLISQRESLFDVRERVVRVLREEFQMDVSSVLPANALEDYHRVEVTELMNYLRAQNPDLPRHEELLIRKLVETSVHVAGRLTTDVRLTEHLYRYVYEWSSALNAAAARRLWVNIGQEGNFTGIQ
jgi:hypothetical protein